MHDQPVVHPSSAQNLQSYLAGAAEVLPSSIDSEREDAERNVDEDSVDVARKESRFKAASCSVDAHRDGDEECSLQRRRNYSRERLRGTISGVVSSGDAQHESL